MRDATGKLIYRGKKDTDPYDPVAAAREQKVPWHTGPYYDDATSDAQEAILCLPRAQSSGEKSSTTQFLEINRSHV